MKAPLPPRAGIFPQHYWRGRSGHRRGTGQCRAAAVYRQQPPRPGGGEPERVVEHIDSRGAAHGHRLHIDRHTEPPLGKCLC